MIDEAEGSKKIEVSAEAFKHMRNIYSALTFIGETSNEDAVSLLEKATIRECIRLLVEQVL